jgi:hypothetical protein
MKKRRRIIGGILLLLASAAIWVVADLLRIHAIMVKPAQPPAQIPGGHINGLLLKLEQGGRYDPVVDFAAIDGACRFLDGRWDTADFRLPTLTRLLWLYGDRLDAAAAARIKAALLGFKYWMDQGGEDSMCYWSENHQILFATGEYLAGRLFPDEVFGNDGKTGREHEAIARQRLLAWLGQRWRYGFIEWYSNTYYVEDAAPLANLVDFAGEMRNGLPGDAEIATKAAIVLDLLLYDLASQSWNGVFVSTMGRAYEQGKKGGGGDSLRGITQWAFGSERRPHRGGGMDLNLILSRKYRVPAALRAIALDPREVVVRASTGLDLGELRGEGLISGKTPQMMMLWGMEAFSNPEAIETTVNYTHDQRMFSNEFLHDLSIVDIGLLRETGLLPLASRVLRPVSDGVAIQRANTYTYRTPCFQLATAQRYHPGGYGDQQHIWSATLSPTVSIFTTHPAGPRSARGVLGNSPGHWVGNGRNPDAAQHRNVVLAIYDVPDRKGFMEQTLLKQTHAYFPRQLFNESSVEGQRAFGRIGEAWVALVAANPLSYAEGSDDDLVQKGARTAWVCELGSPATDHSFAAFKNRVIANAFVFDAARRVLSYSTTDRRLALAWGGGFTVNGKAVATDYPRFDSPWVKAPRKPDTILIEAGGRKLELSFDPMRRIDQ